MDTVMRTWVSGIDFVMQVVQQSSHQYLYHYQSGDSQSHEMII